MIEVPSNKNESALTCLFILPMSHLRTETTSKQHMDALEDKLLIHALDGQHTLVSKQVLAFVLHEVPDPPLQLVNVERPLKLGTGGGHTFIVLVLSVRIEEFRIHIQSSLKVE